MIDNLKKEFLSPPDEYTAVPFWFWNDDLKEEEIIWQINNFKDKGIMGFVIHPRIGMTPNIQYMSEKYLELVEVAIKEAEKQRMIVFLYDEASYPSGSAHGMVVRENPEYASRGLRMIEYKCDGETELNLDSVISNIKLKTRFASSHEVRFVSAQAIRKISEKEIDPSSIRIIKLHNGKIKFSPPDNREWYILIFVDIPSCGTIRGLHFGEDDGEPGAPPSADILNPAAVKKFINLTHEKYYEKLKKYFGTTIKAFFTDEPAIMGRGYLADLKPWTANFLEWCEENGFHEKDLPVLWFEAGTEAKIKRDKYNKAVNKRLELAFYKQISEWCEQHNIEFTGHPEKSEDIGVLKYFHIPGQDVVWRWVAPENNLAIEGENSTTAKCSSDAARHAGRRRNSNECLGCCFRNIKKGTTYDLPPEDIKWYLDWLFVRGVNLIIPHAFFYSVRGEKRLNERPPDVGPNNLYWPYYRIISDYIKRMSWLMTDSINITEIAVLCGHDYLPWKIVKPLYENQIEFNYLEESLLIHDKCTIESGKIKIRSQSYSTVLIEDITRFSYEAFNKLQDFINTGGNVIVLNQEKTREISKVNNLIQIENVSDVANVIDNVVKIKRDIILSPQNKDIRVSHVIKEGIHFYFFVNEGEEGFKGNIKIKAQGIPQIWDAVEGKIYNIDEYVDNGEYIEFAKTLERRESFIICIDTSATAKKTNNSKLIKNMVCEREEINLADGWEIKNPPITIENIKTLESWTKWEGMEDYSGTISYCNKFIIKDDIHSFDSVKIDLGKVCEVAQLFINGHEAGIKLWGPYVFNIKEFVQQGVNTIEVKVTNSLANRLNKAKLDSGLLGPCKIVLEKFL